MPATAKAAAKGGSESSPPVDLTSDQDTDTEQQHISSGSSGGQGRKGVTGKKGSGGSSGSAKPLAPATKRKAGAAPR